ncbi:MAG: hypothetical protein KGD64_04390, partial [Candidatus Heimdallarchaeota archaeon]|nr:hypothetical protein [Candidatus Heimdallarchaeota archaeon]
GHHMSEHSEISTDLWSIIIIFELVFMIAQSLLFAQFIDFYPHCYCLVLELVPWHQYYILAFNVLIIANFGFIINWNKQRKYAQKGIVYKLRGINIILCIIWIVGFLSDIKFHDLVIGSQIYIYSLLFSFTIPILISVVFDIYMKKICN